MVEGDRERIDRDGNFYDSQFLNSEWSTWNLENFLSLLILKAD